jgi:hypothetical protein
MVLQVLQMQKEEVPIHIMVVYVIGMNLYTVKAENTNKLRIFYK